MLDVEVVVLHVRVGGGGEPALGVEEGLIFAFEQLAVFLDDAVAFCDERLHRPHDFLALVHAADVVRDVAERDFLVFVPVLVVAVEAVAHGEVEPRVLRGVVLGHPALPAGGRSDGSQGGLDVVGAAEVGLDPKFHGELGELLELVIRAEELHVHALHHGGDGLVRDVGEHLLAEVEEVQVGDVAEVEELEVVLPVLVGQLDEPVVALQELLGAVLALAGEDVLHGDQVREPGEGNGFHFVDGALDLDVPLLEELVPILEVVANALFEQGHAGGDLVFRHRDGRHVEVAQVDAELDAVGVGDHEVPCVVLAQALDRELAADGLEGLEHGGPMLAVAEPELGVLLLLELVLEDQIVRVDLFPALGPGGDRELGGFGEGLQGHGGPFNTGSALSLGDVAD
ncbi:hypothetical protein SRABI128_05218 [Microbacterium sp. Bi128]|nr:hypothetical protein SRABI128_05218 [Microbacterium sp. Bi128]